MLLFQMSDTTVSRIIHEACNTIYSVLKDKFLKMPSTKEEWYKIAKVFEERWNFPHCIGALDGKHVAIQAPPGSGSEYFNYKNYNSIVLMALTDGEYKFSYVDVGAYGRDSDGGVFARSTLSKALEEDKLNISPAEPLPNGSKPVPYVIVGDDAFPKKPYLLKPFSFKAQNMNQRIFNYRLSRAPRIIENTFGICRARFRILSKPIELHPNHVTKIVSCICALHNFLLERSSCYARPCDFDHEVNGEMVQGQWRKEIDSENATHGRSKKPSDPTEIQADFVNYFISNEGEVPW